MFYKSSLGFVLFLGLLVTISKASQAPHTLEVDQPKECAENQNFCMAFCLSTNPGTVRARCGKDKISCICTTKAGHSVKVRFIEERKPVPPTRPPPPNQIQYSNPDFAYQSHQPHQPQQHHQNPSWNAEVPQLLVCDGAEVHMEVCHRFCTYNIGATMGVCNLTDFTCSCIGVSPAVVQDVPIPAIFTENIFLPSDTPTVAPPTTPPPMLQQYIPEPQHYWSPITPNHPNYYYAQNQHLAPFQQTLRTQQAPEYPTEQFLNFQTQHQIPQPMETDPWHPIVNGQNQFQQTQAEVDSSEFPPADSMTNATPPTSSVSSPATGMDGSHLTGSTGPMMEPTPVTSTSNNNVTYSVQKSVEVHANHQAEPSYHPQHLPTQLALDKYENHRNKRSKRSYASVMSYGISDTAPCYEVSCGQQCSYSGYDGCEPKCLEEKCVCLCSPKVSLEDVKKTVYPIWGKPQKFPSSSVSNSGHPNSDYTVGTPPPPPALY